MKKNQRKPILPKIRQSVDKSWRWFYALLGRRPFVSFLVALGLLVSLMAISNLISRRPTPTTITEPVAKAVQVYAVGSLPIIQSQAQVKKTGVVSIFAQSSGVVQKVFKKQGDSVIKGSPLAWISTNYTGGTAATIQRQQAQTNYSFTRDNLEANKNLVAQQRQLAQTSRDNTEQLRSISDKSIQETKDTINLNNEINSRLDTSIEQLRGISNPSDAEKTQLTQLLSQKAQLQVGLNQLNAGLRAAQYQVSTDKPPTQLADQQLQLTNQQLDLQVKSLELQEKLNQLSLRAAQIGESLNYPASPFKGKIERIAVVPGQLVNPGELLAVVKAATTSATLEVSVPREIASQIAPGEPALAHIGSTTVPLLPSFISSQPTAGSLFSVTYQLPESWVDAVDANAYIALDLPIGMPVLSATIPYIPLDAIFQTQDGSYVYVVTTVDNKKQAAVRKVTLGDVIGNYVMVTEGLSTGDQVIIDRNVLEGDPITVK